MATKVAQGSFQTTTAAAGNTQKLTFGFSPTVVLFYYLGITATGDSDGSGPSMGFGAAIDASNRRVQDNVWNETGTTPTSRAEVRDDACIAFRNSAGTDIGKLDVQSIDSDGITLVVDTQCSFAFTVHYLALGGDLSQAKLITRQVPASNGNEAYSGAGFTPQAAIFFGGLEGSLNANANEGSFSIGMAKDSSHQGVAAWMQGILTGSVHTEGYGYSGEVIAALTKNTSGSPVTRATFVSMDSDGFTINWLERSGSGGYYFVLLLGGGKSYVDSFVTRTDTTEFHQTGWGFAPGAILMFTVGRAEDTQNVSGSPARGGIGSWAAPGDRSAIASYLSNSGGNTIAKYHQKMQEIYVEGSSGVAPDGFMDVTRVSGVGPYFVMDDADPSAYWVVAMGFNAPQQPGGGWWL